MMNTIEQIRCLSLLANDLEEQVKFYASIVDEKPVVELEFGVDGICNGSRCRSVRLRVESERGHRIEVDDSEEQRALAKLALGVLLGRLDSNIAKCASAGIDVSSHVEKVSAWRKRLDDACETM